VLVFDEATAALDTQTESELAREVQSLQRKKTLIIIAMTRPQYGIKQTELPQSGRNVFIAIDTSKSMLADDMSPNRLTRAKLAAQDLLEKLPGDRVGLVAFAGRAFLQAPLTTDHEAVRESIQALDHTSFLQELQMPHACEEPRSANNAEGSSAAAIQSALLCTLMS